MPRTSARVGQLAKLTLEELLEFRERADKLIQQKIVAEKLALQQQLARIERYERHKQIMATTAGRHHNKHQKRRARAKYKDPNSGATWSGRGKLPRWMAPLIKQGAKREDFRIADE